MNNLRKILMIVLMVSTAATAVFAAGQQESKADVKTANLVYANWEEGVAYTNLAKVILEDMMGYEVTITAADVAPGYASVAAGDQDAFMETWLPVLHKDYIEQFGDDLVDLGNVYDGTQSGLAIPTYMNEAGIKTVSDLKKPEAMKKLDKTIIGIDAGAGIMKTTEGDLIPAYGLDDAGYKLLASSGPAMMAAMKDAYSNEEWIVVTAWKPHSMFGYYDLTFLEQDGEQIWGSGDIHITARKGLTADKPELAQFLTNMNISNNDLGSLMVAIRESDEGEVDAARAWLAENKDVVTIWIP
ncbi:MULTISPECIES: glycine betaine ABC transporter substrate-binding protein [unclassified Oceanispirochaeta]|uniref:glycine betaine ABC transporter substrate-binding protein n=1 Tax=unclassified Oceanispirochaeta TaxID=2635722 RepID=UPI000E099024|nr:MULTISPECIES: glycine betaine ABC transporter substrate-binding protein [unclassified Oceanispirochaeta]MBF9017282.1 glycine betaine ABC transporter substrate-binding protein [Oceanispirochaeta sp. M2]NPD73792.1 glycine betaine ABC transporter substrate-binding protein [Oceanispirochaeta sp. M1]RDG30395.1 glycine/betaine ABC transporter substrate-binding protein [Oceanispirochaeta sp. M1]